MIDSGGRIKETSIESMAKTLHSLTYTNEDFDPTTMRGPRINILFTNFSRFEVKTDDIGIPGLQSVNKYVKVDEFDLLIKKFKTELASKIFKDLKDTETIQSIENKLDIILPKSNFYAFKVSDIEEKRNAEQCEIERLL